MNIFFSSDFHLGHGNILRYCHRPMLRPGDVDNKGKWVSKYIEQIRTKEMDDTIIRNVNERIKADDMLFHVGDFCFSHSSEASEAPKKPFEYYREQINCKNIVFLRGNHDKNNSVKTPIESIVIYHGGKFIKLTHRPDFAEGKYELNFVGHVHTNWAFQQKTIDCHLTTLCNVGVDVNDFYPVTYGEIISKLIKWRKDNGINL